MKKRYIFMVIFTILCLSGPISLLNSQEETPLLSDIKSSAYIDEDNYEENDDYTSAYNLSSYEGYWLSTIDGKGSAQDSDYYEVVIPENATTLYVSLEFSHSDEDIDLEIDDEDYFWVTSSYSITDNEYCNTSVNEGETYYILVLNGYYGAEYDLMWTTEEPILESDASLPNVNVGDEFDFTFEMKIDFVEDAYEMKGNMLLKVTGLVGSYIYFTITMEITDGDFGDLDTAEMGLGLDNLTATEPMKQFISEDSCAGFDMFDSEGLPFFCTPDCSNFEFSYMGMIEMEYDEDGVLKLLEMDVDMGEDGSMFVQIKRGGFQIPTYPTVFLSIFTIIGITSVIMKSLKKK